MKFDEKHHVLLNEFTYIIDGNTYDAIIYTDDQSADVISEQYSYNGTILLHRTISREHNELYRNNMDIAYTLPEILAMTIIPEAKEYLDLMDIIEVIDLFNTSPQPTQHDGLVDIMNFQHSCTHKEFDYTNSAFYEYILNRLSEDPLDDTTAMFMGFNYRLIEQIREFNDECNLENLTVKTFNEYAKPYNNRYYKLSLPIRQQLHDIYNSLPWYKRYLMKDHMTHHTLV